MNYKDLWTSHSHRINADDSEKYMDEEDFKIAILEWESAKTVSRVELPVMQKTADDKYLYWKSTVVQDDDLRYGDKPKKQYFRTICFDNQQTMIEPSIKLKADNLEIGTVVEIYLPK